MARDTVFLTNKCGGRLQYRVPYLLLKHWTLVQQARNLVISPPVSNLGSVLLLRGDLHSGVLGDGVGVRREDGVVRQIQEHSMTRVLRIGMNVNLRNDASPLPYQSMAHDRLLVYGEMLVDVARLQDRHVFPAGSMLNKEVLHIFYRYEDKSIQF